MSVRIPILRYIYSFRVEGVRGGGTIFPFEVEHTHENTTPDSGDRGGQ